MASNWGYSWSSSWGSAWGTTSLGPGLPSASLSQILLLLTAQKIYDEEHDLWRIYDEYGTELSDEFGVVWMGLYGWLLREGQWVVVQAIPQYYGGGKKKNVRGKKRKSAPPVVDEAYIRKQWELLELRLKNQAENARVIAEEARAREAAQQKAAPLWRDTESIDIQQARDDEEVALLLTLYMEM